MEERYRKAQRSLLLWFCILLCLITTCLSLALLRKFRDTIREKAAALVAADSRQLELNINSYLDKTQAIATLLFSDEDYYLYDASDPSWEEYDRLKKEQVIANRLSDLALMQNFSDFGIIYANGHTVGWFSNVTQGLFTGIDPYEEVSSRLARSGTEDGWFFGMQGNTDRLFYAKRLNPNAILLTSFYNRELETVFEYPEALQGMTIRLLDGDNTILFSTEKEEIGGPLPSGLTELVGERGSTFVMDQEFMVNTDECSNGWKVVCSIPAEVILWESKEMVFFVVSVSVFVVLIFLLIAVLLFRWRTKSMEGVVSDLQEKASLDQLTGLLNKVTFEKQAGEKLSQMKDTDLACLAMLDMDHFKQVNDHEGHEKGDAVLKSFGILLQEWAGPDVLAGRVGGDEFALLWILPGPAGEDQKAQLDERTAALRESFIQAFCQENQSYGLSISIGSTLMKQADASFAKLYRRADMALYYSKNSGKSRSSWYQEDSEGE